ncbi:MAG: SpoVG family protein [Synergistaceae bacterium]|nr:SpoVG family protein [Synergistaceae bacterium]
MAKAQTAATAQASPQEQAKRQLPIEYDVRILSIRTNGSTLATASVNINGAFAIRGVKVMDSSKGPFVSLPGYKAGNGEFKDICFPCTKEARQQFDGAVMDAYQQALTQVQSQSQRSAPDPFRQKTQTQTM